MVRTISPTELRHRLDGDPTAVCLLDVREPEERAAAAITPSIHIPMYEVAGRLNELPKDREIVVYCHSGARSMMVAGFLSGRGFDRVSNLTGGIDAWSVEVDPTVPRYD
jgi:rhodanese-related sulfurtransferase